MESHGDHGFWLGTLMLLGWKQASYSKGHAGWTMEAFSRMPRQLLHVYEAARAQGKVCVEILLSARKLFMPTLEDISPDLSFGYIGTHMYKHRFPLCILTDMLACSYTS